MNGKLTRLLVVVLSMSMLLFAAAPIAMAQPRIDQALEITDQAGNVLGTVTDLDVTRDGRDALTLTGVFTGAEGTDFEGIVDQDFMTTITRDQIEAIFDDGAGNRCDILQLRLGPLDLDLLGLVVELDEVNLDIYAVPGAGNLLGNLLCAVAGLLDGPAPLQAIAGLLDRILGLFE